MGGTFTSYDKIIPSAYHRFMSKRRLVAKIIENGFVALPMELSWGAEDEFINVLNTDMFDGQALGKIGAASYDDGANNTIIQTAVGDCRGARVWKTNRGGVKASGAIEDLTATAIYNGSDGNNIQFVIAEIEGASLFNVNVLWDGNVVFAQEATTLGDLRDNDFVTWGYTEPADTALAAYITAGITLAGGTDGIAPSLAYDGFRAAIASRRPQDMWDTLWLNTEDVAELRRGIAYMNVLEKEVGVYGALFVPNIEGAGEANSWRVSTVEDTWRLPLGNRQWITFNSNLLALKAASSRAGCALEKNIANSTGNEPGAFPAGAEIIQPKSNSELIDAERRGVIALRYDVHGNVTFMRDRNSYRTFTPQFNEEYHYNQSIALYDDIKRNVDMIFNDGFQNKELNNPINRQLLRGAIAGLYGTYSSRGLLVNYEGVDDIAVVGKDEMGDGSWVNALPERLKEAIITGQIDVTGAQLTKKDVVAISIINNAVLMEILYNTVFTE